jgi:hypothetical protein
MTIKEILEQAEDNNKRLKRDVKELGPQSDDVERIFERYAVLVDHIVAEIKSSNAKTRRLQRGGKRGSRRRASL